MRLLRRFFATIKRKSKDGKPSRLSNISYNKNLWNNYARHWTKVNAEVEDKSVDKFNKGEYIEFLGDEWGDKESVKKVINNFIIPYVNPDSVVAEIGCGGGRIAAIVAPLVRDLYCFDIAEEMLEIAKTNLTRFSNIKYLLTDGKAFDESFNGKFDFIYSFDVFVHLDLHTIWAYFKAFKKIISKEGLIFLHTANITAPDGWARFEKQVEYKVEGHYFLSPEIIRIMAEKAHYEIIKESVADDNFYNKRDYLFILKNKS